MDSQEKIKKLVDYAKEHNALETKNYILDVFKENENYIHKEDINQAFYDSHIINIYPKDMQGIYISILNGDWDRLGENVSHLGIDIHIVNAFQNNGMTLFQNSERLMGGELNFNYTEVNKDDIINYFQSRDSFAIVYKTLSHGMKEDLEIIKALVSQIKNQSELKEKAEQDYSDVSPYGGVDVCIHDWQDHYLNMLDEFRDGQNDKLVQFAEKEFVIEEENQKYIQDEILRNEQIIYFVEHKDEYIAKQEYDKNCYDQQYLNAQTAEADDIVSMINKTDQHIHNNVKLLKEVKEKNGFINRFMNKNQIVDLQNHIENLKDEKHSLQNRLEWIQNEIENVKNDIEEANKPFKNLKYHFDYLLKDVLEDCYDYIDNFDEAFRRTVDYYNEAKENLEMFQRFSMYREEQNKGLQNNVRKAVHIQWDVDNKEDLELLPTEMEIPAGMDEEDIADYLSDETGFCHFGFDLVEEHSSIDELISRCDGLRETRNKEMENNSLNNERGEKNNRQEL